MGRRSGLLLVFAVGISLPPANAGDPPGNPAPAPAPRLDPALQAAVDRAISRGVEWLRRQQKEDGQFRGIYGSLADAVPPKSRDPKVRVLAGASSNALGESALALYALRACGVPVDDPVVSLGSAWLRKRYLAARDEGSLQNYGVSLTLLALAIRYDPPGDAEPETARYGRSARKAPAIPAEDLEWMRQLTAWLSAAQGTDGGFGYCSPPAGDVYDHSNTQFALLALKGARRSGIDVPRRVWDRALRHLLQTQERDGPSVTRRETTDRGEGTHGSASRTRTVDRARGWGYIDGSPATGSMTSGGVSSLVICRSELLGGADYDSKLDRRAEQGIWDGLAWLGANFTVKENPGPPDALMNAKSWQYYCLFGIERAGVLAAVRWMAGHDWYREGAAYLVERSSRQGGWSHEGEGSDNLEDSCFALLFLKRATFRVARGGVSTEAASDSLDVSSAPTLEDAAFGDLFDAVFRQFASADEAKRGERAADFVRMGVRSIPLLVRRLDDEDLATRTAALDALRRTTGETRGFDPAASPEARAPAVEAWESWWLAKKAVLVADVVAGRFREPT